MSKNRLSKQPRSPHAHRSPLAFALLALTLNLGCASVSIQRFEPADIAVMPAVSLAILKELPSVPYRAIARIEVRDRGLGRSSAELRDELIATALGLGANAVVLESLSTPRSLFVAPGVVSLYDDLVVSGLAIIQQLPQGGSSTAHDLTPNPSLQRTLPGHSPGQRR